VTKTLDPDLASYIADNYGLCVLEPCRCLKDGWLGRGCPCWFPVKARNWAELQAEQIVFARETRA
jgi:hypothetical protein